MVPDVAIIKCPKTNKFFLQDEYEFMRADTPAYPFGKIPEKR